MTRLFRNPRPRLESYAPPPTREPSETVVTRDADEHRDALRDDPGSYRWVGGSRFDVYDVPDEEDA